VCSSRSTSTSKACGAQIEHIVGPGDEVASGGLAREGEGVASQILLDFGADPETIRNAVIAALSRAPTFDPTFVPEPTEWAATAYAMRLPGGARRRGRSERRGRTWQAEALVVGWAMFGVAAALGVLLGWLIWG
jgi:ClpA/ClpB-like protein